VHTSVIRVRNAQTGEAAPAPAENDEASAVKGWWLNERKSKKALERRGQIRVYNGTGSTLAALKVCKIGSAVDFRTVGGNASPGGTTTKNEKVFSIALADTAEKNAQKLRYCVLESAIANGAFGWAVIQGDLSGNFVGTLLANRKVFADLTGSLQLYPEGKTCIEVGTCVDASSTGRVSVDFTVHKDGAETEPSWFGADEDVTTNDTIALQSAITYALTRKNKTVNISGGLLIGTSSATLAAGVTLNFKDGGYLTGSGLATLTINNKIAAGPYQILTGPCLAYKDFCGSVSPFWWGLDTTGVADCADAIQNAIDATIYSSSTSPSKASVCLPAGKMRCTKTIHLGYGGGVSPYRSCVLEGQGYVYRNTAEVFNGTVLVSDFANAPAISMQGGRGTKCKNFSLIGKNFGWVEAEHLGGYGQTLDDTDEANWIDPVLLAANPNMDSQYAPYAGIAIDPYSGTAPSPAYPNVTFPAVTGLSAQYGKEYSSDNSIEGVYIAGFTVAVVNQPCDADANGDFTSIKNCWFEMNKYGVSVGNTQSRNLSVTDCKVNNAFTVLTNNTHGRQVGKFGSIIKDLSVFQCINLIDFGQYAGPVQFEGLYAESLWRIGDNTPVTQVEGALTFSSSEFSFDLQDNTRGVPANVMGGYQQENGLRFNQCMFTNYPSVLNFDQVPLFDGCQFRKDTRTNLYEKFAHNVLCGGLVTKNFAWQPSGHLRHQIYNLDSGAAVGLSRNTDLCSPSSRLVCVPRYTRHVAATSEQWADDMLNPVVPFSIDKSVLSSCTLVGKVLTIVFSSRSTWEYYQKGMLPGDVIRDDATGSVFFIRSRTTTTIIAELQNNYKVGAALTAFSTTVGNLYYLNSRIYTPSSYLRGDLTAGSTEIAGVARDDTSATFDAEITVGDWMLVQDTRDRWASPTDTEIAARSQAAGTITISGAGALRNQTKRRLDWFVRQPPANV
jgi:hypothetical protein